MKNKGTEKLFVSKRIDGPLAYCTGTVQASRRFVMHARAKCNFLFLAPEAHWLSQLPALLVFLKTKATP